MHGFFRNTFLAMRGAVVGQIIPILAMPLISRLYSPADYGLFSSILSLSVILAAITMLQMEVAVVLPQDEGEAGTIARAALQTGLLACAIATVALAFVNPLLSGHQSVHRLSGWILLTPALAFLLALTLLCNYIATRQQNFRQIGNSAAMLQFFNCVTAIALGAANPGVAGLIGARFAAQGGSLAGYRRSLRWLCDIIRQEGLLRGRALLDTLRRYHKFPLFTMPHSLLMIFARENVPFILVLFHQPHAAGFYSLVRSALLVPTSLLSTSLGQLFYREATRGSHRPCFQHFCFVLTLALACLTAPGGVFIMGWASRLFSFIFGNAWAQAGLYAALFMPVALLSLLAAWCMRVFEVRGRQELSFRVHLVLDTLAVACLAFMLHAGFPALSAVAAYLACQFACFLVILWFIFRLLCLPARRFFMLLLCGTGLAAAQACLHAAASLLFADAGPRMLAEGLCAAGLTLGAAVFFYPRLMRAHKDCLASTESPA